MPVPTTFADLSTTIASNSPAGSDNVFPDLDNYIRALAGMLASVSANSGNGWTSPYLALLGGTVSGSTTFSGAVTLSGSVSGAALTNYLAAPAAIGGTTPAAGAFTTLSASSTVSGAGFSTYLASPPAIGGTAAAAGSFTTLSASGAVTLSGGTANGVLYLNGSKVATSGSALVFDGSNLGIGTSSPGTKLDVQSSTAAVASRVKSTWSDATQILDRADASSTASFVLRTAGTDGYSFGQFTGGSNALEFRSGGSTRLLLDTSGNLGLGVTPSAWESTCKMFQFGSAGTVGRASSGQTQLGYNYFINTSNQYIYLTNTQASRYEQIAGEHRWLNAASGTAGNTISFTQAMTLDASGRLLIGRTGNASGEALQIDANGVGATVYSALIGNSSTSTSVYNTARWNQGAAGSATGYVGTGGSTVGNAAFQNTFVVGTQTSHALVLTTNDTERARITATGNVVAGNSTALATNATDGFLYVPTCAGTPTGVPTAITGMAPIVVNTTNNKLYFYSGGAWRDAGP